MVSSLFFRLLIATTSQVPVGAATGAEEELVGADDRSVPAGAAAAAAAAASATVSHEHKGAQSETSLHMRWAPMIVAVDGLHWLSKPTVQGRLGSQIWLAIVQPPQWAVVPHVYLLHLSGGKSGIPSAVAIRE